MEEQANNILVELLQKASNGIDAAVSFSQTQLPDVVHQLLLWNMVDSLIKTLIAILTIPLVFRFMKKQCQRVEIGKICDEGYSWERGNPKYRQTMVWDSKGEINFLILPLSGVLIMWGLFIIATVTNMVWLKIWLAPKLYLIEYAASLIK
ncbi:hypothetical protein B4W97_000245 [Salmonella enterica subsp. enterica serovar Ohio]|uniref:Phage transmembrane protein n=5 Tax=Salmonella enterica TaxID=28901 RepID=A0A5T2TKN7_SALER|nr:hypothetical protein [Salmonella enterica]EBH5253904.1 hypothetical protein [Salmonella enterica subsp. enterica serovar 6,7:b:-]EBQ9117241.1 hypothetical protein [Salmonella enterica subsp. enterica serovar Braenderup]EBR8889469.1 hypothetical protein [Salmonella enterica subsp. enterica serovar Galiema]EBV5172591.1 hypothetical protein [Salmonella enterica subsp. enterica serovar Blockley]EBW8650363.1 hypothetical protein [Salmonella enterica subsp. enterica serovar Bredeney]ECM7144926.1